jgi:tetratricopeptide (TPR) repeat protein
MLRAGRLDDAERVAEEFRRTSPDNPLLGVLSGRIRKKRGELDRAAREYAIGERAFFGADNYPERIVSAAEQEGWQGYCRAHLAWLHERVARGYVSAMSFAIDYAELGDAESAITWLEKAVQAHDMGLLQGIRGESSFEILRTDERYREIVRRLGFNPT